MVPVPPLLVLSGCSAAFIVAFRQEWQKAADVDRDEVAPVEQSKARAVPKLRRDPQTGTTGLELMTNVALSPRFIVREPRFGCLPAQPGTVP